MKKFLNNLNERERWIVILTSFCLFFYLYYLFLYKPIHNKVAEQSLQRLEKIDTLHWMQKISKQQLTLTKKQLLDNSQLLTLFASQLKEHEILQSPYQLQQISSGNIQLIVDAVPFPLFISWLLTMDKQYLFAIKQLDVDKTKSPGVVKLKLVVSIQG